MDNGLRFLTNWRYSVKEYVSQEPLKYGLVQLKSVQTDDYDKFYSQCDKTMVGFVQDKNQKGSLNSHLIQCFYAVKEESDV